jgi:L-histidine N-alpha-methyltransferase
MHDNAGFPDRGSDRPTNPQVAREALAGLTAATKTLPPKLFYDRAGCQLFDEITRLPEYYVTRTELALLRARAPEIAATASPGAVLVEYGACDETKAALMLGGMDRPSAYLPIDVAGPELAALRQRMRTSHPHLAVQPIEADFLAPLTLPRLADGHPRLGFFPGSTIGNMEPATARRFLMQVRATLGHGARFVVGADLRKDPALLVPAYDDAAGVTAAFNLNLLIRLNREAAADFELESFAHRAVWNAHESRIEMHLVSLRPQQVRVAGQTIRFDDGETIHTENSYKHTVPAFRELAASAGWRSMLVWTDPQDLFSIHLLEDAS